MSLDDKGDFNYSVALRNSILLQYSEGCVSCENDTVRVWKKTIDTSIIPAVNLYSIWLEQ